MKLRPALLSALAVLVAAAAVVLFFFGSGRSASHYARAEYSVKNLTCGSCARNIQQAVATLPGTGEADVSVTMGRATVEYDPAKISVQKIARAMTQAGYPAESLRTLAVEEYRNLKSDQSRLAARYVARIGDHLLSRDDFAREMSRRMNESPPKPGLLRSVWEELRRQELLLLAAERNGVVVPDAEVALEIDKMRKETPDFEKQVEARFGGREAFSRRVRNEMIIDRNIEEHVLPGIKDDVSRRQKLDSWFRELAAGTAVTIFDPALKAAVESGSGGCGGSCCG